MKRKQNLNNLQNIKIKFINNVLENSSEFSELSKCFKQALHQTTQNVS